MTDGMSMTVYATTSCRAHPARPPIPLVMTIARGEAILALLHSSERWKGASWGKLAFRLGGSTPWIRHTIARHGPDDSDEGHENGDSIWPIRPILDRPNLA